MENKNVKLMLGNNIDRLKELPDNFAVVLPFPILNSIPESSVILLYLPTTVSPSTEVCVYIPPAYE